MTNDFSIMNVNGHFYVVCGSRVMIGWLEYDSLYHTFRLRGGSFSTNNGEQSISWHRKEINTHFRIYCSSKFVNKYHKLLDRVMTKTGYYVPLNKEGR